MTTSALKKKIQQRINTINNNDVLEAVYTILNNTSATTNFELSDDDIKIIKARKKAIKNGTEKTYTVAQVKKKVLSNLRK